MLILEKKVAQFKKKKEDANTHLKIYDLSTKIDLKPEIKKLVFEYENPLVWKRDVKGEVRKLFARLTGRNIVVESRIDWVELVVFLVLWLGLCCAIRLLPRLLSEKDIKR